MILIEYLKKAEEQENKGWYYYMAKDHFAHVGAYRKCIDKIEQLKKRVMCTNLLIDIFLFEVYLCEAFHQNFRADSGCHFFLDFQSRDIAKKLFNENENQMIIK